MALPDKHNLEPGTAANIKSDRTPSKTDSIQIPAPEKASQSRTSSIDASSTNPLPQGQETKQDKEEKEKPAYLLQLEEVRNHDADWIRRFQCLKYFLIIFGRWPFTYEQGQGQENNDYVFKFSWKCPGFFVYCITAVFTLYGFLSSSINAVHILMTDKVGTNRTKTQILEQGLAERHTMILIIVLGSHAVNTMTMFFIFVKRHEIPDTFSKWTRFLRVSKLNGGSIGTYSYTVIAMVNYLMVISGYLALTHFRYSATFIGGPTVIGMLYSRHFLASDYLELDNFVGSKQHHVLHSMGLGIFLYVVTTCNVHMYLFLWLMKSILSAIRCWNTRLIGAVDSNAANKYIDNATTAEDDDDTEEAPTKIDPTPPEDNSATPQADPVAATPQAGPVAPSTQSRLGYQGLYNDHIGLVRMLSWSNSMFTYTLEPYLLFMIIRIVYQMYLAALVIKGNGKSLSPANVGKYFIRKHDYVPAVLLTYENCFMLLIIFLASSWLEDAAYESYDFLRKTSLLKGTTTDSESFFYLSMFQSYTSPTKMAVYAGQFFCIDRYTILHVLAAVMSNFLVVYQFAPLFDMDTINHPDLRNLLGNFLTKFEGLRANHFEPVSDNDRNNESF